MLVSQDKFKITAKYKYIYTENRVSGIKILPIDSEGEDVNKVVCEAVGRDSDTFYKIMEAATLINHITGNPLVRKSVLYRRVILEFFKGWNLADSSNNVIPMTAENVGKLHHSLQKELASQWLKATG